MPTSVLEFSWPDRVVIGTIGRPGNRTFYLQVRAGKQLISIALEKQQSAQLAEKIDDMLDELIAVKGNPFSVPAATPIELVDNDQLEDVEERFRTGAMGLGWDPSMAQIVIEAYPITDMGTDSEDESAVDDDVAETELLRVRIPVGTARAFAKRTREVVGAGRQACPLCGFPMDPDGHTCTLSES